MKDKDEMKGYEKQKQLVGVKRRGRKHHPTLPLHPVAHLPYHPTLPLHPTTHLPYHPTLPHTYHTPTHTPTTHLPKTYPTMHLPHTYPTCIYKHLNNNTYTEYQTIVTKPNSKYSNRKRCHQLPSRPSRLPCHSDNTNTEN